MKRKLKFQDYKNCLEATQLNKINHLEKNKINEDSLKKEYKEFIKKNKIISKLYQKLKSENHAFSKEINKNPLSSNDDKRIQSVKLIETYAYRMSKDLVSEKEEIKCKNIIKQHKKWLTLMMLQKKA